MASSLVTKPESPYQEFRHKPINRYKVPGYPVDVPLTITDRDGSLIYENEGLELLVAIIVNNDVEFLKEYFAIHPRAIPKYFDLPDDDEAISDFGDFFRYAAESGSLGTLQTLLDYTTRNLDTTTPRRLDRADFQLLNVAARFGRVEIVRWLINNQPLYADIHDRDTKGFTALAAAANLFELDSYGAPTWDDICFDNNEAIMNLLLDHGACASDAIHLIDEQRPDDPTVLTLAAQWASAALLGRLIDGGANVHHKVTVRDWELNFGDQRDLPVEIEVNALFLASLHANPHGVKTLVDQRDVGVDVTDMVCSSDCVGSLPLHWAARSPLEHIPSLARDGRAENIRCTIEQLLDFAPTTVNTQDNDGNTALHYATRHFGKNGRAFSPIFGLLCSRGANASLRNYKNETPLHTLFQSHGDDGPIDIATVSLLLSHGAKVTDVDEAGNTPLHIATKNWHFIDAISTLLEYGADPTQKNLEQENALPMNMEHLLGSS